MSNAIFENKLQQAASTMAENYDSKEKDLCVPKCVTYLGNMNFSLLKRQKMKLLEMREKDCTTIAEHRVLDGIIHLIDAIQDDAVEVYSLPKNRVFYFPKK